jgi:hypothetical protein
VARLPDRTKARIPNIAQGPPSKSEPATLTGSFEREHLR